MGVRLSSNNHCKSKLTWAEEYPEVYLFSTSKGRNEPSSTLENINHPCQGDKNSRDEVSKTSSKEK